MSADWYCRYCSHYTSNTRCTCDDPQPGDIEKKIARSKRAIARLNDKEALKKRIEASELEFPLGTTKVLKSELCKHCGEITRERYRQMKAMNTRRWQQIQKLEAEIAKLREKPDKRR